MSPTASARRPEDGAATGGDPGAAPAIEAVGLRKEYRGKVALHDLSLTVWPGEVFGFLGPNGAGKTTAIKILTGLVHPTAGRASLFGQPVGDRVVRRRIGYLPESFRFHDWLTGAGLLDFHGRLAGLDAAERRARIPVVLRRVGLAGRGDDLVRGYSKGMTQRIGLAQAILAGPRLVLLDEPTSALDPLGRREVRDLIRELAAEGVTVFLNSHLLGEVEMVCDRVAIVDRGRVIRSGRLAELVGPVARIRLTVDRVDPELLSALGRRAEVLGIDRHAPPEVGPGAPNGATVTLGVADLGVAPEVAEIVVRSGVRLYGLVPVQRSLEDVFVDLVKGGDGDGAAGTGAGGVARQVGAGPVEDERPGGEGQVVGGGRPVREGRP